MSVWEGDPPRVGRELWKSFAIGSVLIVLLSAPAVAGGHLLMVHETIGYFQNEFGTSPDVKGVLNEVLPGNLLTMILLG